MNRERNLIKIILAFSIVLLIVFFITNKVFDIYFISTDYNDVKVQVIPYLEYLRQNFWATHDLFPQLNMNYGLSQSYAVFYYYGMYNPILMLAFFLPFISIPSFMQLVVGLNVSLNFIISYYIFKDLFKDKFSILLGAALVAGSGYAILESTRYMMFGTSYTGLLLMILGTNKIFYKSKSLIFILGSFLVYTTNFTFMFSYVIYTGIYLVYLILRENENFKFFLKKLKTFILSSVISLCLASFVILPQVSLILSGGRFDSFTPEYPLFHNISYIGILFMPFTFLLILLVIFYGNKENVIGFISILLIAFFVPLFNLMQLNESSSYKILMGVNIILAVILMDLVFKFKNNNPFKRKLIILLVLYSIFLIDYPLVCAITLILIILINKIELNKKLNIILYIPFILMLIHMGFNLNSNILNYMYLLISTILIISYIFEFKYYNLIITIFLLFSVFNFTGKTNGEQIEEFNYSYENNIDKYDEYRDVSSSELYSIGDSGMNLYTSIENSSYYNHFSNILDFQKASYLIDIDIPITKVTSMVYGVKGQYENLEIKPMIYGTNNIYSIEDYENTEVQYRLLKELQGVYIENSESIASDVNDYIQSIYSTNENVVINAKDDINFQYVNNLGAGEYIINFELNEEDCLLNNDYQKISINNELNHNGYCYTNMNNQNNIFTYYIPVEESEQMNITVYGGSNYQINNIEVDFISDSLLNSLSGDIVYPENFKVDMNHGYSFEINMPENGYINTTIPYDEGFTVYIDNLKVHLDKSDFDYLAFPISEGTHNVVIEYHITGFKVGIILTFITTLYLLYIYFFKLLFNKVNN